MTESRVVVCYHDGTFIMPDGFDPPSDRFASTPGDNLAELAGRVCYSSIDKSIQGRPTKLFFDNLLSTRHHSVAAHTVPTFEVSCPDPEENFLLDVLAALHCRPGVWVTRVTMKSIRFCASLRAVIEWPDHGPEFDEHSISFGKYAAGVIGSFLQKALAPLYPMTLSTTNNDYDDCGPGRIVVQRVPPELPKEKWCSLYIDGVSRDLLQELNRHHWQANPSVRSTRFVDESECTFIRHPAFSVLGDNGDALTQAAREASRTAYRNTFTMLTDSGVDKKTARGAARSMLLGTAETKLVFSLSQYQARHILNLRGNDGTGKPDPEIRALATKIREALLTIWPDL